MEFIFKLLGSAFLALLIKGGVALAGHSIAWMWAAIIAIVVVFGGFIILSEDVIS